ncbi:DUF721 domain-containing protein [Flavobacterium sp. MXW15]|uniref:DUF721 domain-containing protein n=1 Tax=Xanthomonas chitinilytica TaxID=2989819 RepID=A0ABT3JTC9_9XANT|nr:DUF721 domain-containing protein [Xanthomonas sp. H13-6]MCW4454191.1 DUF721 domain-containing protein [Flavobacterium sp. MXW15]MCW4471425.1 DUF721 domain-containing protein [Xanthomonas sp. H13-6]
MSEPKSSVRPPSSPKQALEAVMADKAGNPLRRALWLDALDRQLRPHLPPSLASRCRLANVDGEHLVFLVESPVWHAKLRLAETQLLDAARSIGLTVTRVTIKTATAPLHSPVQTDQRRSHAVSAATHKGLRDALACLQDEESTGS